MSKKQLFYMIFLSIIIFLNLNAREKNEGTSVKDNSFQKPSFRQLQKTAYQNYFEKRDHGLKELLVPQQNIATLLNNPIIAFHEIQKRVLAGDSINTSDKEGNTPLMKALFINRPDLVELFIRHGASIDHKNHEGKTAFDIAFSFSNPLLFSLLAQAYPRALEESFIKPALEKQDYEKIKRIFELLPERFGTSQDNKLLLEAYKNHDTHKLNSALYEYVVKFFYTQDKKIYALLYLLPFNFAAIVEEIAKSLQPFIDKDIVQAASSGLDRLVAVYDYMRKHNLSLVPFTFVLAEKSTITEPFFTALSYEHQRYGSMEDSKPLFEAYFKYRKGLAFQKVVAVTVQKMFDAKDFQHSVQLYNLLLLFPDFINDLAFMLIDKDRLKDLEKLYVLVNSPEAFNIMRHPQKNISLFDYALTMGKDDIAVWLLDHHLWDQGKAADFLVKASRLGLKKLTQKLLQLNPEAATSSIAERFMDAVKLGDKKKVAMLLNGPYKNNLALQEAFQEALTRYQKYGDRYKEVLQLLATPQFLDQVVNKKTGNTRLHEAVINKDYKTAELLIQLGADNLPNNEGITPLGELALQEGSRVHQLSALLEAHGAHLTTADAQRINQTALKEFKEELPNLAQRFKNIYAGTLYNWWKGK